MSNQKVQAKSGATPAAQGSAWAEPVSVVRLEMNKGTKTQTHSHETECMLIVLQGACRVYLQDRAVTIEENQMLHIPGQHEHVAEALTNASVLSISTAANEWHGSGPVLPHDADQYLWGV